MGWRHESIVEEYTKYAHPKTRESDISYIQGFEVKGLSDVEVPRPDGLGISLLYGIVTCENAQDIGIYYIQ